MQPTVTSHEYVSETEVFCHSSDPFAVFQYETEHTLKDILRPGYWDTCRISFQEYIANKKNVFIDVITRGGGKKLMSRLVVTKCEKRPSVITKTNKPGHVIVKLLGNPVNLEEIYTYPEYVEFKAKKNDTGNLLEEINILKTRIKELESNFKPTKKNKDGGTGKKVTS